MSVAVVVLLVLVTLVRPDTTFYVTEAERSGGFERSYQSPMRALWSAAHVIRQATCRISNSAGFRSSTLPASAPHVARALGAARCSSFWLWRCSWQGLFFASIATA